MCALALDRKAKRRTDLLDVIRKIEREKAELRGLLGGVISWECCRGKVIRGLEQRSCGVSAYLHDKKGQEFESLGAGQFRNQLLVRTIHLVPD